MSSTTVEVNGPESDALPVTLHALSRDFSYNDEEPPVPVTDLHPNVVLVESVQTPPANDFSYNEDERPVPVLNPSLVNGESVQTPPRNDCSYNEEEQPVPALNPNLVHVESVQTPPTNDFSYIEDEAPVLVINPSLVNGELVQMPPTSDFSYNGDELPVAVLNPSLVHGESVQTPPRSDFFNNHDERPAPVIDPSLANGGSVQTQPSFTIDEPTTTAKCASPKGSVPIEGSESTSPKSPRLSSSTEFTVATSDYPQHPENKWLPGSCLRSSPRSCPVMSESGNAGRSKLERVTQNVVRRSPRLLSPPCPETEVPKLKRRSCVEEVKVEGGNGTCEKIALTDSSNKKQSKRRRISSFVGEPVPENEARERWGWRYELKGQIRVGQSWILNAGQEDEVHLNVVCHYLQANVDGCIFSLGDCAHIKGEGKQPHVGRIVEFFKTSDDESYFRVQWFFRAVDTVMKDAAAFHDKKRLFSSTLMNDNLLECILSKVNILEKPPMLGFRSTSIEPSDYYCDMEYAVKYSTFRSLVTATDSLIARSDLAAPSSLDTNNMTITTTPLDISGYEIRETELALLDLYAGCGGMSTGLCLGAKLSGVKLVTRWAIDYHKSACDSLKLNHPETEVRHTTAEDFLELLKEWEKLCKMYLLDDHDKMTETNFGGEDESIINESSLSDTDMAPGEYEVSSLVDICYGDPSSTGQHGLKFKVRWKGYGPSDDTWEPIETLSDCQGHIQSFVRSGYKSKILPFPGDVDVICGGPPCQGISGYNRFRNTNDPLNDERNQQIVVFFDIVKFLHPKYVLMENVADILRFDKASLGRYALSRLVHMNYQARLGIMAAGSYGLPQFRLRVFLWGAHPNERLPQFPLPTHEVIVRYFPPAEFEQNTVAYDEGQPRKLQEAIVLRDAISDLPAVTSHETREEMAYDMPPETEFQKYIRLTKDEFTGSGVKGVTDWKTSVLTDHRSYKLSEDDYHRVCHVPRKKGANFRDFPGINVRADNTVHRDPKKEVLLPSGRPLIPDYVFTFEKGKSKRPFARVWWDENVPTVITFPNIHSQAALHPEQDRVLTLRENARLQGFPDHYRFCGNIKERYCQVGNAVAVSVSKTLGYALGMAFRKLSGEDALMTLPPGFAFQVPALDDFSSRL